MIRVAGGTISGLDEVVRVEVGEYCGEIGEYFGEGGEFWEELGK